MPELVVGQAGKELTHNQALAVLDQLAQAVVVDKDLTAPPGSPANGAMYIVAAGATGAWAGQSGKLAYWLTTVAAWTFIAPADGWSVWVVDEADTYSRVGGAWVSTGFSYNRGNILGTVSQSAGVPTGAIIEQGSNANGNYVRYADGTQICAKRVVGTYSAVIPYGAVNISAKIILGGMAAGFVSPPTTVVTILASESMSTMTEGEATESAYPNCYIVGYTQISGAYTVNAVAIGRWY